MRHIQNFSKQPPNYPQLPQCHNHFFKFWSRFTVQMKPNLLEPSLIPSLRYRHCKYVGHLKIKRIENLNLNTYTYRLLLHIWPYIALLYKSQITNKRFWHQMYILFTVNNNLLCRNDLHKNKKIVIIVLPQNGLF